MRHLYAALITQLLVLCTAHAQATIGGEGAPYVVVVDTLHILAGQSPQSDRVDVLVEGDTLFVADRTHYNGYYALTLRQRDGSLSPAPVFVETAGLRPVLNTERPHDIGQVRWGMSPAEVRQQEKGKLILEAEHVLNFMTEVLGRKAIAQYTFAEGQLAEADFFFLDAHADGASYLNDYRTVREQIAGRYGPPAYTYPEEGEAQEGFVREASWITTYSLVDLYLNGDEAGMRFGATFTSRDLRRSLREQREKMQAPGEEQALR